MSPTGPRGDRLLAVIGRWARTAGDLLSEYYQAPYRRAVAQARRDQDDLFMILVFSDLMGVPNPATYFTLELQPVLLERFHEWHTRMGMAHSPLEGLKCC